MKDMSIKDYLEMLNWDTKLWTILSKEEVKPLQEIKGHQNYIYTISPKGEKSFGKGAKVVKIEWMNKHLETKEEAPEVPENKSDIQKVADVSPNVDIPTVSKPDTKDKFKSRLEFLQKNGLEYHEIDDTPSIITPDGKVFTGKELAEMESEDWQAMTTTYSSFKVAKMKKQIEEELKQAPDVPEQENVTVDLPDSEKAWLEKNGWNPEKFLVLEEGDWEELATVEGYELYVMDSVKDDEAIELFGKNARIVSVAFIKSLEDTKESSGIEDIPLVNKNDDNSKQANEEAQLRAREEAEEKAEKKAQEEEDARKKEESVADAKKKQEAEAKVKVKEKAVDDSLSSATEEIEEKAMAKFKAMKESLILKHEEEKQKIREEYKAKESKPTTGNLGGLSALIAEAGFGQATLSLAVKGKGKVDSTLKIWFEDIDIDKYTELVKELDKLKNHK